MRIILDQTIHKPRIMTLIEFGRKEVQLGQATSLNKVWASLAEELGLSTSLVKLWANGTRRVADLHVIPLEVITGGEVKRHHTRPDIYPWTDYS